RATRRSPKAKRWSSTSSKGRRARRRRMSGAWVPELQPARPIQRATSADVALFFVLAESLRRNRLLHRINSVGADSRRHWRTFRGPLRATAAVSEAEAFA